MEPYGSPYRGFEPTSDGKTRRLWIANCGADHPYASARNMVIHNRSGLEEEASKLAVVAYSAWQV